MPVLTENFTVDGGCRFFLPMQTSYLEKPLGFRHRKTLIESAVKYIGAKRDQFDVITCRGTSGLLIAPTVAYLLDVPLLVVRKADGSHSNYKLEGTFGRRYLIIDDFISSGATIDTIKKMISERHNILDFGGVTRVNPTFKIYLYGGENLLQTYASEML